MNEERTQIKISNLWKVFGKDPKRILSKKFKDMKKEDVLKKTGCVIGMRDISLDIKRGEFYILMGLSGSGKSTLIRNIIRLVKPTSGSIEINGKDITKMNKEQLLQFRRDNFGMVFQHYGLLPHLTVLENAAYGLKIKGLSKEDRFSKAKEALETVGLKGWEEHHPTELSGGMQQRVGLARALANDPDILLMDEPFSGLDPLIRRQMQDELIELQDKLQKTIIFVTHDLHEALKLGDRIAIMRNGELVQVGTPEDIVSNPADDYVKEFVQDASPAKVLTAGSIMEDPKFLLYNWEGPKTAQAILGSNKRRAAFVVDKAHKLVGVLRETKLQKLINESSNIKNIPYEYLDKVESVTEDTVVEELFSIATKNSFSIPVCKENGKLIGVVTTDSIFESITPKEVETDA